MNRLLNPLVWYIGAGTRIFCGPSNAAQFAMNGVACSGVHTAGAVLRMILGSPVDPELQKHLVAMRNELKLTQYRFPFE